MWRRSRGSATNTAPRPQSSLPGIPGAEHGTVPLPPGSAPCFGAGTVPAIKRAMRELLGPGAPCQEQTGQPPRCHHLPGLPPCHQQRPSLAPCCEQEAGAAFTSRSRGGWQPAAAFSASLKAPFRSLPSPPRRPPSSSKASSGPPQPPGDAQRFLAAGRPGGPRVVPGTPTAPGRSPEWWLHGAAPPHPWALFSPSLPLPFSLWFSFYFFCLPKPMGLGRAMETLLTEQVSREQFRLRSCRGARWP